MRRQKVSRYALGTFGFRNKYYYTFGTFGAEPQYIKVYLFTKSWISASEGSQRI